MRPIIAAATALLLLAADPPASRADELAPNSVTAQHEAIMQELARLAAEGTPTASAAQAVLDVMTPHLQKEQELVLPLLAILPRTAENRVTPDMAWAVPVAERLAAERSALFDEHGRIMEAVGTLIAAGEKANDPQLVDLGERIAMHAMSEIEILEPSAQLVGETVRRALASGD